MKNFAKRSIGLVFSLFWVILIVDTAEAAGPIHLRFASHVIGGTGYMQAAVIAQAFRPSLPKGSTIDVLPYSGGIGNIKLAENGECELYIKLSVSDRWAWDGSSPFKKKYIKIRGIAGGTDTFYFAVVATNKSGIKNFGGALNARKPIRLMTLTKGSTGEATTRHMLKAYGISYDDIKSWGGSVSHTGFGNIKTALRDGKADVMCHGVGVGHPSMTEIALTVPVTFLPLPESVRKDLTENYGYGSGFLPTGTFKGQNKPIPTVTYYLGVSGVESLPNNVVYTLVKAMAENKEAIIKGHKSFKMFDVKTAWRPEKNGCPLHPGAEKYYKENAWME